MFIIGIAAAVIIGNIVMGEISVSSLAVLGLAVAYGAVGLVDDYAKIKKKENAGLTPKQKLVLQILVAGVFILVLFLGSSGLPQLWIPFTGISVQLAVAAVYRVRGVRYRRRGQRRQSDRRHRRSGGKRYAAGCHLLRVRRLPPRRHGRCDLFGGTRGALLGFLRYNFNPAKVFMGDTGSLFLGGAVAGLAFACEMPLILLLVGLIYIIETLSVILQVTYFKATHGKRLFKMAPIHHHFEMCGWGEKKIVLVFTGITVVLCLLAYHVALAPLF